MRYGLKRNDHHLWIQPNGVDLTTDPQQAKQWDHAQEASDWLTDDRHLFFAGQYEPRPIPDPVSTPSSENKEAA